MAHQNIIPNACDRTGLSRDITQSTWHFVRHPQQRSVIAIRLWSERRIVNSRCGCCLASKPPPGLNVRGMC